MRVRSRPVHAHLPSPFAIVLERKNVLDGLRPARPRLEKCLEASAKLVKTRVRMLSMPRGRTINSIQRRCDFQNLAPGLEKVVLENIRRITRFLHQIRSSAPSSVCHHHGKSRDDMQTFEDHRSRPASERRSPRAAGNRRPISTGRQPAL
jgi:hypothetical protein